MHIEEWLIRLGRCNGCGSQNMTIDSCGAFDPGPDDKIFWEVSCHECGAEVSGVTQSACPTCGSPVFTYEGVSACIDCEFLPIPS